VKACSATRSKIVEEPHLAKMRRIKRATGHDASHTTLNLAACNRYYVGDFFGRPNHFAQE
jgi:hypothetical protein